MAKSKAAYINIIMGIVSLVIVILIINTLSKKADIQDYGKYKAKIDKDKKLNLFAEGQKDSVTATFAGFWQYDQPLKDSSVPGISDRIEIKKNGIIWRVVTHTFLTPSNDTAIFIHAMTAYLRPFANNKENPIITFDTHIIRQTFVGKDTCYGEGDVDTTWEFTRTNDGLLNDSLKYMAYDTSNGKLGTFFPEGAVAMVDAVSINQCNSGHLSSNLRDLAIIKSQSKKPVKREVK